MAHHCIMKKPLDLMMHPQRCLSKSTVTNVQWRMCTSYNTQLMLILIQKLPAYNKITYSWMCFLRLSRNWFLFKSGRQTWLAKNPDTLPSTLWWRFWYAGWKIKDNTNPVGQRNVSLFSGELDNGKYDALVSVDEKERLGIFNKVCFYRQPLAKKIPLDCSNA